LFKYLIYSVIDHLKSFKENNSDGELDSRAVTIINKLEDRMYGSTALLKILIHEGIQLIKDGVNPDKVMNWVNTT